MALPKWTDERTDTLTEFVGEESPVSQSTVIEAADELETSPRSVASKLRKMGYEVELASAASTRAFSEDQESTLANFVSDNSGEYTYAQIAENFEGGAFSAKSIQGKILSMELTGHVKPAPKVEAVRTYSEDEETTLIEMVNDGAFVEAIADALAAQATAPETVGIEGGVTIIETSATWTNDRIWIMNGKVVVRNGGVLNIEAGTIIKEIEKGKRVGVIDLT